MSDSHTAPPAEPSVFSKIISGELPGRFVYEDDVVVAFLTIAPVTQGHTLVVPRQQVDQWTDLPADVWSHLNSVAAAVGRAVKAAFSSPRSGYLIAGFEVPHTHIHVFPAWDMEGFDLSRADSSVPDSEFDEAAERIRAELTRQATRAAEDPQEANAAAAE